MGALVTKALRPIKTFNVENRAHRVISKDKPTPAPMYPQAVADIQRAAEADPKIDEKLDQKSEALDKMLKDVYVTSEGTPEDDVTRKIKENNPLRPLPMNRMQPEDYEFGFQEPTRIPHGSTTLKKVTEFLSAHQINPKEVTAERIAEEYTMRVEDVENIIKYFKTYDIYIPETKNAPATFAGPSTLRKEIEKAFDLDIHNKLEDSKFPELSGVDQKTKLDVKNVQTLDTVESIRTRKSIVKETLDDAREKINEQYKYKG